MAKYARITGRGRLTRLPFFQATPPAPAKETLTTTLSPAQLTALRRYSDTVFGTTGTVLATRRVGSRFTVLNGTSGSQEPDTWSHHLDLSLWPGPPEVRDGIPVGTIVAKASDPHTPIGVIMGPSERHTYIHIDGVEDTTDRQPVGTQSTSSHAAWYMAPDEIVPYRAR